jgi:hypothetical protein
VTRRRHLPVLLLAGAAFLGCAGSTRQTPPESVLRQYARALEEKRLADAYDLLGDEAKKGMPFEAFQTIVQENPEEIKDLVASLRQPAAPPRITATVATPDGEALLLVFEDGQWRIDASAIDLYDQETPRSAVRSFIRAVDNERYDVILRFVPDDKREGLDEKKLREAFEGEQKDEVQQMAQALRASLSTARIERIGDRATMGYGAGGTVQLVREHGVWKIEEF